ncbi:MAG: prepilin-type N-terminal cleavage/methylation domain-containing protein, partial [Candidatus Spechtbacteria bacterium]|nr:prepilin-type N-terminal cleavage/methylation domain-containing protein [Candidatus Spechtbacteria bacterium]
MKHSGVTLVEFLVVLGISAILVGISGGVYFTFLKRSSIETEARKIASVLYLARNQTLASENEQSFGVRFISSTGEYILFPGTSFNPSDQENKQFRLPSQIFIDSVQLQGGGDDVMFSRLSGATSQYGFVQLKDRKDTSLAQVLCIDSSGALETRTACPEATLEYTGAATSGDLASFPSNAGWGDPAQSFIVGLQNISVREVQLYVRK